MTRILPAARRSRLAWKNGGGTAAEVAWRGVGTAEVPFDWRVTLADIDVSGPFSDFPGVDRVLMCVSSGGLRLVVDGLATDLRRLDVLAFDGGATVSSVDVDEPALALNLLLRRGAATGSLGLFPVEGSADVGVDLDAAEGGAVSEVGDVELLVIVLAGAVTHDGRTLHVFDALRARPGRLVLEGSGLVVVARLEVSSDLRPMQ